MPVDVVGDPSKIKVSELVVSQKKDRIYGIFDPDRDIKPETWEGLTDFLNDRGNLSHLEYKVIPAVFVALVKGDVDKEVLSYVETQAKRIKSANYIWALYILSPDKVSSIFLNQNEKKESYDDIKNIWKRQPQRPNFVDTYTHFTMGTIFSDLFNKDQEFKEDIHTGLVKTMSETETKFELIKAIAAFRICFPQDKSWPQYFDRFDWKNFAEYYEGRYEMLADSNTFFYIATADKVVVSESGLKLEFGEKPESQETPLPERRKY